MVFKSLQVGFDSISETVLWQLSMEINRGLVTKISLLFGTVDVDSPWSEGVFRVMRDTAPNNDPAGLAVAGDFNRVVPERLSYLEMGYRIGGEAVSLSLFLQVLEVGLKLIDASLGLMTTKLFFGHVGHEVVLAKPFRSLLSVTSLFHNSGSFQPASL